MSAFVAAVRWTPQPEPARPCADWLHWLPGDPSLGRTYDLGSFRAAVSERGALTLVRRPERTPPAACLFEGSLENRENLCSTLNLDGDETDGAIVFAAHERWGEDCLRWLHGEFAFVVWSGRAVFAGCDPVGLRSLTYCVEDGCVTVGSRALAVARASATRLELDQDLLRDYIHGRDSGWIEGTGFRNIRRVPPGCVLLATPDRLVVRRADQLGTWAENADQTRDPADCFRELFFSAVHRHLRRQSDVGVAVSGGLDSSSVASVAALAVRQGTSRSTVKGFSLVFPDDPVADEREFQAAIQEQYPELNLQSLDGSGAWYFQALNRPAHQVVTNAGGALVMRMLNAAASSGNQVLLSGLYGDQVLGPTLHWSRLLNRSHGDLAAELSWLRQRLGIRGAAGLCVRAVVGGIRARLVPDDGSHLLASHAATQSRNLITSGAAFMQFRNWETWSDWAGVRWGFPFLDRALVEFLLKLPTRERTRGAETKVILRRAMQGVLPEVIRMRPGAANFIGLVGKGRVKEAEAFHDLVRDSRVVSLGLVDSVVPGRRLKAMVDKQDYGTSVQFHRFASAEAWIRQVEGWSWPRFDR